MSNVEDEIKNTSIENRFKMAIKNPNLAGLVYQANEVDRQKNVAEKAKRVSHSVLPSPLPILQGDTRGFHPTGLHTLTAAEIVANASKRDPTAPYYEEGGNVGRWVDPMAPHWDHSGDFAKLVDPRKPGPIPIWKGPA